MFPSLHHHFYTPLPPPLMAPTPFKSKFPLLYFFTLLCHVQSILPTLPTSDSNALFILLKDLNLHHTPHRNPCNSAGIFCEQPTGNNSHVLTIIRIVFKSHHLNGRLSPVVAKLSELKELSLPDNELSDKIPPQIAECHKLEVLNLAKNRFSGEIPPGLSSLVRLRVLDLSSNKFTGNLKFLKYFPNLEKLNLADNMFAGKIPVSLRSFRNLVFVNVSGNVLLEGPSPLMKAHHDDQYLSSEVVLTENERIPSKRYVFVEVPESRRNQSASAMAPSSSFDPVAPSPSPLPSQNKRGNNKKKRLIGWTLGFVAGAIAGILSGGVFTCLFRLILHLVRRRKNDLSLKIFSPMIKKPEDLAFLKSEDGLASLEVIGKGGCGEVYKAVLPGSNGKEIAIKKIVQPPRDAEELTEEDSKLLTKKMRQIKSEIQTVGHIRHKNLLPLLAHLPRPDCHYLVYEYMKNGSLQDCLQQVAEGRRELDWMARYKITLGVASGLEYLHMLHSPRIIHRDIKPANVLLDDEMDARIADFGLAKAVPDANTHASTSNVAGTLGYIAPEYHQTLKLTDKCDIYSFGMLLSILVMGKFPSDDFFRHTEEMVLVKWMRNVMVSDDPKRAIDSKLLGNGYEEQMLLVLKIACFCTLDDPKERPNSKEARTMLSQIKH